MKLYKYCDKNGINILQHKALKISRIDEFNDPYEFRIAKSRDEDINSAVEAAYDFQKKWYRVVCFTSIYNNLILWSHYSRNHTGILIKFDTSLIAANVNGKLSEYLEEVEYENDMIEIPSNFLDLDTKNKEKILKKNTHRKYLDWRYEGEYRGILHFDYEENKRYIDLPPDSILEVVIGMNCNLETELDVKNILGSTEYSHVKLKRSFLHETKYEMKYVDIGNT